MTSNGIGPMVRQFVHERNAARKAGPQDTATAPAETNTIPGTPSGDSVLISDAAMARFEAWKAKHTPASTESTELDTPVVDTITEEPATEPERNLDNISLVEPTIFDVL